MALRSSSEVGVVLPNAGAHSLRRDGAGLGTAGSEASARAEFVCFRTLVAAEAAAPARSTVAPRELRAFDHESAPASTAASSHQAVLVRRNLIACIEMRAVRMTSTDPTGAGGVGRASSSGSTLTRYQGGSRVRVCPRAHLGAVLFCGRASFQLAPVPPTLGVGARLGAPAQHRNLEARRDDRKPEVCTTIRWSRQAAPLRPAPCQAAA